MSKADKHIQQYNYNQITKDSRLLAHQVTLDRRTREVKGTTAMNEDIQRYSSVKDFIERKATFHKNMIKQLQSSKA